ncbi:MAG: hypothetical protein JWQ49_100 [Edaphobacter sp.]|nr:hypothetical protein [Edaphobacter sp.]
MSTPTTLSPAARDFLSFATSRLDRLDQQAMAMRMSALKMAVYITVGPSDTLRHRCIVACIDAGLLWSPIPDLNADVERVIAEVLNGK